VEPIKNIMVCLDLTEMDNILMEYAAFLCTQMPDLEKVVFAHNIKFDYPQEAEQIIDNLQRPLPELLEEVISGKLESHFQPTREVTTKILIEADSSTPHALARMARIWDAGITLVGKKIAYRGSGLTAEKLLRLFNFETALLMIPEATTFTLDHLVVPTDFSENAMTALAFAKNISESSQATLQSVHVLSVPAHYFPYIPVSNVSDALRKDAEKNYRKFLKTAKDREILTDDVPATFVFSEGRSSGEVIYEQAVRSRANMIVVGARGKGGWATLLGSVTVQLIKKDMYVPLLIVRRKATKKNGGTLGQ